MKENEKQDVTGNDATEAVRKGLFPIIGRVNVAYQIVMFLLKSYYAFVVTYRLAFESIEKSRKEKIYWVVTDELMDLLFLIDIIITFNRPYYDDNNQI